MDDLARRFLGLALRLDRLTPGLMEAYAGPGELREAIASEPVAQPRELHDEALAVQDAVAATTPVSHSEGRRVRWLTAQAGALATVARLRAGEEIALPDLVESLVGLAPAREPEAALLGEHRLLDAALPPGPSLRMRLASHRVATEIPPEQLPEAAERLMAVLRQRARQDLELPDGEAVVLDPVHGGADTRRMHGAFEPPLRTRLTVNLAHHWSLEDLVAVIAGEAYPGRHTLRVGRLAAAAAHGRHDEVLAWLRPTPDSAVVAGVAATGREVLLGDFELAAELRRIGHDLGLVWDVERELEVARSRERLGAAAANAALLLNHDGLPRSEARAYLAELALLDSTEIDVVLAPLDDPLLRVEPFARSQMPRVTRDWLSAVGQTDGLRRLLTEQLTPAQLREESGVPA